jgi:hypothetical protein
MRARGGARFDIWVVDEGDDPATFPAWLAAAVKDRFDSGLFVLTSDAGVIEARPGDLILRDGDKVSVHIGQEVISRGVNPRLARPVSVASRAEFAPTHVPSAPSAPRKTDRPRSQRVHGVFAVLAVTLFLGLLAFGLAWMMIRLTGRDRSLL